MWTAAGSRGADERVRKTDTTETAAAVAASPADDARRIWLSPVHPHAAAPRLITGPLSVGRAVGPRGLDCADRRMSRAHFELRRTQVRGTLQLIDQGTKNGTRVDGQRADRAYLTSGSVVRAGDTIFVVEDGPPGLDPRPGESAALGHAHHLVDRVAPTALTVLIRGATGAGKERLAQRLHDASGRTGPFVPVNCTTLPENLAASELFGHVRGAYSGAIGRPGLFAAAAGGTLFLDEVGDLPLAQQPLLLRALQERKVRPVGAEHEVDVDVRVVAATHQDLAGAAQRQAFRADLLARLTEFEVDVPDLTARRADILPLFRQFVGMPISADAAEALLLQPWLTNIRGLQAVARRIRLFAEGAPCVELSMLPSAIQATVAAQADAPVVEVSQADLERLLRTHGGNVSKVARALSLTRQQVYRRLQALDVDPRAFR